MPADAAGWYASSRSLYYGIPVTVRFAPADAATADEVWAYLGGIDGTFNAYRDDSELGRINRGSDRGEIDVSPALADAVRQARRIGVLTDGAFDVSVRPLVQLWRDAARTGIVPGASDVERARAVCGLDRYAVDDVRPVLTLHDPHTQLDLGGIVKGIAVDGAIAILRRHGVTSALVQVGGETAAFGTSPRGQPHVIGVQHPTDATAIWAAVTDPKSGISVSTSGNYQQPVTIGETVYYHIVDPRTGAPVDTKTLSVSIAFPTTGRNALADGLSTAGAVLGPQRTFGIVAAAGGEALFLLRDGVTIVERSSPGWRALAARTAE